MIMKQLLTNLIFLGKMKINNYRFQQQQKAKQEHKEAKKMKEAAKKAPVSATEELDYIKKLLSGESVEDFKSEDDVVNIEYQSAWGQSVLTNQDFEESTQQWLSSSSEMTLMDYLSEWRLKTYFFKHKNYESNR